MKMEAAKLDCLTCGCKLSVTLDPLPAVERVFRIIHKSDGMHDIRCLPRHGLKTDGPMVE